MNALKLMLIVFICMSFGWQEDIIYTADLTESCVILKMGSSVVECMGWKSDEGKITANFTKKYIELNFVSGAKQKIYIDGKIDKVGDDKKFTLFFNIKLASSYDNYTTLSDEKMNIKIEDPMIETSSAIVVETDYMSVLYRIRNPYLNQ